MAIKDSSGDNAPANTGKKDYIRTAHNIFTITSIIYKLNKKRPNGRF